MAEANKDHKQIKRKSIGKRPLATEDGMYILASQTHFMTTFCHLFFYPVAQVNMFHQAKSVQFINSVVTAANNVSNQLV